MSSNFEPMISERAKLRAYFFTDLGILFTAFAMVVLLALKIGDSEAVIAIGSGLEALFYGLKQTFKISSRK